MCVSALLLLTWHCFNVVSLSDNSNLTLLEVHQWGRCSNKVLWYLTFIGPYILIYSYSITNKMHLFLKLFILIKRSTCFGGLSFHHQELKLHIQQQAYVKQLLLPAASGSCLTYACCSCLTYACCCMCSLSSWWWTERPLKHVECFIRINNLRNRCILLVILSCFFLSCKANARVKLAKTGHGPNFSTLVVICVVLCNVCV
jgi:hypothetical protein